LYVYTTQLQKTLPDRGSVISIATSYGLYGPGIDAGWRRDFLPSIFPDGKGVGEWRRG